MKLSDDAKKDVLNFLLGQVASITDKEYQKKGWIRGEGPEWDDFEETVCHFFHEGDAILENYNDFGITERQHQLLKQFRDEFRKFSDTNDFPEDFIETPEWGKIMELAGEVLKAFNYQKRSRNELA